MPKLRDYSQSSRRGSSLDMPREQPDIGVEGDWDPLATRRASGAPPVTGDPRLYGGTQKSGGRTLEERMYDVGATGTPKPSWYTPAFDPYGQQEDPWQEELGYAQLEQQKQQFGQEMAFQQETFGFEKTKWADLTKFQKEQFEFSKEKWEDEKGQWERQFTFQEEKWGEEMGFEREKWEHLTEFQQEQFDFSKQQLEDQKGQFQENLAFRKDQWKEELKIAKRQLKKRPPPVWGV